MKKFALLLILSISFAFTLVAQDPQAEQTEEQQTAVQHNLLIPQRETIVIDNFTGVPNLSLGFFEYLRKHFIQDFARKDRLNVIDVADYGYGRPEFVFPSLYYTRSKKPSTPYDLSGRENIMAEFENARYYMTVYISYYATDVVVNEDKKERFSATVEFTLYCYDCVALSDLYVRTIRLDSTSNPSIESAEQSVVYSLYSYINSYIDDNFKYTTSILQLGEFNKKGKLQDLFLSCGEEIGVCKGDYFYVYSIINMNGIESRKKLGKLKVKEVTGPTSCRCSISNGGDEIATAFNSGAEIIVISDTESFF